MTGHECVAEVPVRWANSMEMWAEVMGGQLSTERHLTPVAG